MCCHPLARKRRVLVGPTARQQLSRANPDRFSMVSTCTRACSDDDVRRFAHLQVSVNTATLSDLTAGKRAQLMSTGRRRKRADEST